MTNCRDAFIEDEALAESEIKCRQISETSATTELDVASKETVQIDCDDSSVAQIETKQASVDDISDDVSHDMISDEETPGEEPVTLDDVIEKLNNLTDLFKAKISRSGYEEQVLKRYSDEIHEYKADLYKKIMLPLIKEVIAVRDATQAIIKRAQSKSTDGAAVDIKSVGSISEMLEAALDNYGVTTHTPLIGSLPETATERPVGRIKTASAEMHGAIASIMNDAYLMDDRCIAPAKVKLFVYDAALEEKKAPDRIPEQAKSNTSETHAGSSGNQSESEEIDSVEQDVPTSAYLHE